ncbi:MAG: hypothetical protein R3335_00050 [Anaerolineales bacterium]|nr:hypothetical protein [Anaerolineales bacterium]
MAPDKNDNKKGKLEDAKEAVDSPKPYTPPEVTHELDLETRAGTPVFVPETLDGIGPDL